MPGIPEKKLAKEEKVELKELRRKSIRIVGGKRMLCRRDSLGESREDGGGGSFKRRDRPEEKGDGDSR